MKTSKNATRCYACDAVAEGVAFRASLAACCGHADASAISEPRDAGSRFGVPACRLHAEVLVEWIGKCVYCLGIVGAGAASLDRDAEYGIATFAHKKCHAAECR